MPNLQHDFLTRLRLSERTVKLRNALERCNLGAANADDHIAAFDWRRLSIGRRAGGRRPCADDLNLHAARRIFQFEVAEVTAPVVLVAEPRAGHFRTVNGGAGAREGYEHSVVAIHVERSERDILLGGVGSSDGRQGTDVRRRFFSSVFWLVLRFPVGLGSGVVFLRLFIRRGVRDLPCRRRSRLRRRKDAVE